LEGLLQKSLEKYAFEYAKLSTVYCFKETDSLADGVIYIPEEASEELEGQLQKNLRSYTIYSSASKYSNEIYSNLLKPTIQRIINMFASKTVSLVAGSNLLFVGLGASIAGVFGGISQVFKPSIKKRIENKVKGISENVNYFKHTPIIVRIISDHEIEISKKLLGIGKKFIKLSNSNGDKVKMKFSDTFSMKGNKHQLVFQVYLSKKKTDGEANFSLTTQKRVRLPFIDPLLDSNQWREAVEGKQNIEIESIILKKRNAIDLSKLKSKDQTLFYSILNSEYHINPILEYNLDSDAWSFIENTKSLDKQLVEGF